MEQKNKKILVSAIIIIILLGGGFYFLSKSNQSVLPSVLDNIGAKKNYEQLPPPAAQTGQRQFEVISATSKNTLHVRDSSSKKELDLFIPSDAKFSSGNRSAIKAGAIIVAEKWMEFANGVVVSELNIKAAE